MHYAWTSDISMLIWRVDLGEIWIWKKVDLPIVGIVVTTSPNFNLYKIVVFPAASRPTRDKKVNN